MHQMDGGLRLFEAYTLLEMANRMRGNRKMVYFYNQLKEVAKTVFN
jgi:hypothetical protein